MASGKIVKVVAPSDLNVFAKYEWEDGVDLNNQRTNRIIIGSKWVNGASTNFSIVFVFQFPNSTYVFQCQIVNTWNGTFSIKCRSSSNDTTWGNWKTVSVV